MNKVCFIDNFTSINRCIDPRDHLRKKSRDHWYPERLLIIYLKHLFHLNHLEVMIAIFDAHTKNTKMYFQCSLTETII